MFLDEWQPTVRNIKAPHFRFRGLPANVVSGQPPKSEFFDESADCPGAINPRANSTSLDGWTAYPEARADKQRMRSKHPTTNLQTMPSRSGSVIYALAFGR